MHFGKRAKRAKRNNLPKQRQGSGNGRATTKISLGTLAMFFPEGSLQRVYFHGKWQISRGRKPSMKLRNQQDPRQAFAMAMELEGEYLEAFRKKEFWRSSWQWEDLKSVRKIIRQIMDHEPIENI